MSRTFSHSNNEQRREKIYILQLFSKGWCHQSAPSQSPEIFIIQHTCHSSIIRFFQCVRVCKIITFANPLLKNAAHAPENWAAFLHTEVCVYTSDCLIKAHDEIQNEAKLSPATNTGKTTQPAAVSPWGDLARSASTVWNTHQQPWYEIPLIARLSSEV